MPRGLYGVANGDSTIQIPGGGSNGVLDRTPSGHSGRVVWIMPRLAPIQLMARRRSRRTDRTTPLRPERLLGGAVLLSPGRRGGDVGPELRCGRAEKEAPLSCRLRSRP